MKAIKSKDNGSDNDNIRSNRFIVVVIALRAMKAKYISNDNDDNNNNYKSKRNKAVLIIVI